MGEEQRWAARQSTHFRVRCTPGSFAEQRLDHVTHRLEAALNVITELLAVDAGETITVTLVEGLAPLQKGTSGGMVAISPERRAIREIYRPDAPGVALEASVLRLVLTGFLDHPPVPFLFDGLLACVTARLPGARRDERQALQSPRSSAHLPPLTTLFSGPRPQTAALYAGAAQSFVTFLLATYGAERFKEYMQTLRPGHGPEAATTAFGVSMPALERSWHKSLTASGVGGIVRFVRVLIPYLRPYRFKMAEIVLYVLMAVAFSTGFARVQGIVLDRALILRNGHVLAVIMTILAGAFVVMIVGQVRASYLVATISGQVLQEMRLTMFALVQRLEPGFFHEHSTGDILARMSTDLDQVQAGVPVVLAQGLRMVLTVLVALAIIFTLNWKLALLALLAVPLLIITGRIAGPRAARASLQRQRNLARSISTLQEDLAAQSVVKAYGLESWEEERYRQDLREVFRAGVQLFFVTGLAGATYTSIGSLSQLTVLGVGGYLVVGGQLTVGTLVAFLALTAQVIGPLQNLSTVLQTVQQASGGMERVQEMLANVPRIVDAPGAVDLPRLTQGIALDGVSFAYAGADPVLQNITLSIAAGDTVALVGPSGCGKSTLLNLVTRFYEPDAGSVRFDGRDLREATLHSLRTQLGIVLQESFLFNLSVRENIRLGKPGASDDEVIAAARLADVHDAILAMPAGYDTPAGEGGNELSGGQRQRVAIARALIRDPAVLLLDEATSALDAHTEAAIGETLETVRLGRTTIIVTHRLASIMRADCIVVLADGAIAEQGTHAELLTHDGLYAALWREQTSAATAGGMEEAPGSDRLRSVPLFRDLSARPLSELSRHLYLERYRAGESIVEQGEAGDKLYIIRRGQADVVVREAGRVRPLAVLHDGDHFGEIALLRHVPRTATITARTDLELWVLESRDFDSLLNAQPQLRIALQRVIDERNRNATGADSNLQPA